MLLVKSSRSSWKIVLNPLFLWLVPLQHALSYTPKTSRQALVPAATLVVPLGFPIQNWEVGIHRHGLCRVGQTIPSLKQP